MKHLQSIQKINSEEVKNLDSLVAQNGIEYFDFRFVDLNGKERRVIRPVKEVDKSMFEKGFAFDGSSIPGWKSIESSDTIVLPDLSTMFIDKFSPNSNTIVISCYVLDGDDLYALDPKSVAKKAEEYLRTTRIADTVYFGPELEFFIFDDVEFKDHPHESYFKLCSGEFNEYNNNGYSVPSKAGYFNVPPHDSFSDLVYEMSESLTSVGLNVEIMHREVSSSQAEIGFKYGTLAESAYNCIKFKYAVKNTAARFGKTVTFMPKPVFGDNGTAMHLHQSLWLSGKNLFYGDKSAGLSDLALHYIGGIIKHGKALNAFCNPSTNSYKRLVPGYEAPVTLAYSSSNRSAAIRIPLVTSDKARRIETRFPDPTANPYLAMSAVLMAGLDGIKNKIDPGKEATTDLYNDKNHGYGRLCHSLMEALDSLDKDRDFLKVGGVFNDAIIDSFIHLKKQELIEVNRMPNPKEFALYYSC